MAFDPVEEIRRDHDALERGRDTFLEGIALLAGERIETQVRLGFSRQQRTAESAFGEGIENLPGGGRNLRGPGGVLPGRLAAADEDTADALGRRSRRLLKRAAHVDRFETIVDAGFDRVRLDSGAEPAQRLNVLFTE